VPTLLEVEGFRFYFFSLEGNEPPHVHVRKGGGKAKLWLSPVELVYARGFTKPEESGEEIRWPTLDEDLSVPGLLGLPD